MRSKVRHSLKTDNKKRIKLSEINELSIAVFIVKRERENMLKERIKELNGRILSIMRGIGVSRSSVFESLKIGTDDCCVFLVTTRVEDVRDFMQTIAEEFELTIPGNGKGFTIDVDGYLGAKAVFVEE